MIGQTFGRLVVLAAAGKHRVRCRCACGAIRLVLASSLRCGKTKSCGCLRRELAKANLETGRSAEHARTRAIARGEARSADLRKRWPEIEAAAARWRSGA